MNPGARRHKSLALACPSRCLAPCARYLGALLLLTLVACGVGLDPQPIPPTPSVRTAALPSSATVEVTIYLPRLFDEGALGLQAARRTVPSSGDLARDTLEALIRGPDGSERAAHFQHALDRRTRIVMLHRTGPIITLELSADGLQRVHGRPFSELVYWSLVYTLTEVPGIEQVTLVAGDQPVRLLGDPPFPVPLIGRRVDAPDWARPRAP